MYINEIRLVNNYLQVLFNRECKSKQKKQEKGYMNEGRSKNEIMNLEIYIHHINKYF